MRGSWAGFLLGGGRGPAASVHIRSGGRHSQGDGAGATGTRGDRGRTTPSIGRRSVGKATVLDVRPTESPLTCLPRSGLSSAHVSSRTRAFNRNKSPHVSRLRGRRSQRRGEVGSWNVSVVDAHPDRSSPKWPSAGRSPLFSKETRGCGTVRGTQNMTAIDNRFPKPRPLLGPPVDRWPSKPRVAGSNPAGRATSLKNSLIVPAASAPGAKVQAKKVTGQA